MREQKNTTVSFVMNWKRKSHVTFISTALTIGMYGDTCGCIAGEVLLRICGKPKPINRLESFHGKVKAYPYNQT